MRSSSIWMIPPGGHPTQRRIGWNDPEPPTVSRPQDTTRFVKRRIAERRLHQGGDRPVSRPSGPLVFAIGLPAVTFGLTDRG
ncbi:hypothetical protein, partial [Streptomyces sulfonofaciens]|uniref:hypothetical protein n=1 Tax=Streptomyces sulfonofaciens TaxID=68272 RepID=UPI001E597C9A